MFLEPPQKVDYSREASPTHEGPSRADLDDLRWGPRRRLEFIDFRLMWNGRINRADIGDHFGISPQQSSADLAAYERLAPENMRYDRVQRTFLRSAAFRPLLVAGLSDRYLLQLQAVSTEVLPKSETWFDRMPAMEVADVRRRPVEDDVLMGVLDAMRENRVVRVRYLTMSGKDVRERRLSPHALGQGSGRWHARCFDFGSGEFRDFNLNRMLDLEPSAEQGAPPSLDVEWNTSAALLVRPNSSYPEDKREAVRKEFGFVGADMEIGTRISLAFYILQDLLLDPAFDVLPPERRQLELVNGDELQDARLAAREDAARRIAAAGLAASA